MVFEQIIFVLIPVVVDDVCLWLIRDGFHVLDGDGAVEHGGREPAAEHAFVRGVRRGHVAVAAVGARVHDIPVVHTPVAAIVRVVEVGQVEAVAVFVAHGADARHLRAARAVEFGGAGVRVDLHAVEREVSVAVLQPVAVRPNRVGLCAAGLAISGVDDIYLVHLSVAVPVVFAEIHLAVYGLAGFCHHIFGAHVVALGAGVCAVVRHVAGEVHGTHDVKLHIELTVRLVVEVVAHAAVVAVDLRAARIHHFFKLRLGAGRCHFRVGKVHEDQQGALFALEG